MQIVNIVCSGVISMVIGILSLVFYNDPRSRSTSARWSAGGCAGERGAACGTAARLGGRASAACELLCLARVAALAATVAYACHAASGARAGAGSLTLTLERVVACLGLGAVGLLTRRAKPP